MGRSMKTSLFVIFAGSLFALSAYLPPPELQNRTNQTSKARPPHGKQTSPLVKEGKA